ncbi:PstS family phosphate ABC transporter substrate-binding protein [Vibrio gallicus]|uniref:PstS family phosphate ABC transporter substrate-binding protein n=1 Tax=Vibrio gallicus TaxID=190897 RepID=UPI0021C33943|nr:PstS family phosphate ABC transporter substrate-binding protein [Vibrio gallicus]
MKYWLSITLLLFSGMTTAGDELPSYQKIYGVSGNLSSIGSDSLAGIMSSWAEDFSVVYPSVNMQVHAAGSSSAIPALTQGTAQFGPMSRLMKPSEIAAFEKQYGYEPTALVVALDAVGVYVHQDNPIKGLNFRQLDSIFSATNFCGSEHRVTSWSELGVTQNWGRLKIQTFGRNSVSGTHEVFKSKVLCGGDFRNSVNEMLGASSVVQSVASSPSAIGYSGVASSVVGSRLVALDDFGDSYTLPTRKNIISGKYPLGRKLYVYVNKPPNRMLSRRQREFIKFIYSHEGQDAVVRSGYISISKELAQRELAKLGLKL